MSPEQARGQDVDKRTDIWAFGCVLFAMLTGRPFDGDTLSDVIAATLTNDPDWTALPDLPESIRRVLRRCLDRDLRRRLRDIGDVRADLDEPIPSPRPGTEPAAAPLRRAIRVVSTSHRSRRRERVAGDLPRRAHGGVRLTGRGAPADLDPDVVGRRALRVTHDDGDPEFPRWTADGRSIVYYTPGQRRRRIGHALGSVRARWSAAAARVVGWRGRLQPRRRRIAMFHTRDDRAELMTYARDDGRIERIAHGPRGCTSSHRAGRPTIAGSSSTHAASGDSTSTCTSCRPSGARAPASSPMRQRSAARRGCPTAAASSTARRPGARSISVHFNLRRVSRDGSGDRALTFGDMSYVEPDVHRPASLVSQPAASRTSGGSRWVDRRRRTRATRSA